LAAPLGYKNKALLMATDMLYVLTLPLSSLLELIYTKLRLAMSIDHLDVGGSFLNWILQAWMPLTVVGYIQWLVLVPRLIRFWRDRNDLLRVFVDHLHKRMGATSVMAFIVSQLKAFGEHVNRS
jgi:hypothetical protein